jgi:hypothetical protein
MDNLQRSLADHPLTLLRVIADLRGMTPSAGERGAVAAEMALALADPAAIACALADLSAGAIEALETLAAANGRLPAMLFQRRYGEIRPFGSGRLAREQPWQSPTGPAEELWYRGWIFRGFAPIDETPTEVIFVPDEILGLLPRTGSPAFAVPPAPTPPAAHDMGDAFVQDMVTLLATIHMDGLRQRAGEWQAASLVILNERLRAPETLSHDLPSDNRLALLLHLAERMEWTASSARGEWRLQIAAVRRWMEMGRSAQWQTLWSTWRDDETWDDLRRLSGLACEGAWHNDPIGARRRLLSWLGQGEPGRWQRVGDWVATLKAIAPDFLRPESDYDSWYIRPADGDTYLRGFEHWDEVEGQLARYLLRGPLHWMGVIALDAEGERMALTLAGQALLRDEPPPTAPTSPIAVDRDFTVAVPASAASYDRFRVARFAAWEASPAVGCEEPFRYRITRTALQRATAQGITVTRILAFLSERAEGGLPENVAHALQRWPGQISH